MQPRLPLLVVAAAVAAAIGACAQLKTGDVSGVSDASATDAATTEEVAPIGPRFCDTVRPKPNFCDDFDGDDLLGQRWDNAALVPDPGAQGGGALAYDTSTFLSAPRSVVTTTVQLLAADDEASAYLMKTLPVSSVVNVGFAFNVTTASFDGEGNSILGAIVFEAGGVLLVYDELGAALAVVPKGKTVRLKVKVPLGVGSRRALCSQRSARWRPRRPRSGGHQQPGRGRDPHSEQLSEDERSASPARPGQQRSRSPNARLLRRRHHRLPVSPKLLVIDADALSA